MVKSAVRLRDVGERYIIVDNFVRCPGISTLVSNMNFEKPWTNSEINGIRDATIK